MKNLTSALEGWSREDIQRGKAWVRTWQTAGVELERIRQRELRGLDTYRAIALLYGPMLDLVRVARPRSGLVEQQYWFMKAAGHH
jgi:hypothetical protein